MPAGRVITHDLQKSQYRCACSVCRPPRTRFPSSTSTASAGRATVSEKALPVIFWQPRQWQAMVSSAGRVMRRRTAPQRQVAVAGSSWGLLMTIPWVGVDGAVRGTSFSSGGPVGWPTVLSLKVSDGRSKKQLLSASTPGAEPSHDLRRLHKRPRYGQSRTHSLHGMAYDPLSLLPRHAAVGCIRVHLRRR